MLSYHGKERHKHKLFLSTIIYVIVIVTRRENNSQHVFLMYVMFLWTTVLVSCFTPGFRSPSTF